MACCLLLVATAISATNTPEAPLRLTILHTNDLHAHDESFLEHGRSIGGLPRIGHMIRFLRSKDPKHTLVIDAGDIFQGTPLFTKYKGDVEVNMLNKIGYDIYTIGNHEFDEGPQNLAKQLSQAKFAIISCNLDCTKEPELAALVKPSIVKEIDGQKIAFIGAEAPDLNALSLSTGGVRIKSVDTDWMQPIKDEVAKYKSQGINKIILVTHIGLDRDKELAKEIPDVDAIIGGHSHTRLDEAVVVDHPDGTSTTIVQTGCYGRTLGELELTFDAKGKVESRNYHLINITEKIHDEPDLKAYVDEKVAPLLALRHEILSKAQGEFSKDFFNLPWDSTIGDLLTDAWFEEGKQYGVQMAFQNRGGIRAGLDEGDISAESVEELLPFPNKVTFATISGQSVLANLEHSFKGPGLGGSFLDEHGLKIAYDPTKPDGSHVVFALLQDQDGKWKPIDPKQKYKIVVNDFTYTGGEGFKFQEGATDVQPTADRMSVAFKRYLAKHKDLTPQPPSRIVPISSGIAQLKSEGSSKYVEVKDVAPNAHLTLVEGQGRDVASIDDKPVPFSSPKVIESDVQATADGTYKFKLPPEVSDTKDPNKEVCVIVVPPRTAKSKRPLVSYPLPILQSH